MDSEWEDNSIGYNYVQKEPSLGFKSNLILYSGLIFIISFVLLLTYFLN